jgi:hypothetical protein
MGMRREGEEKKIWREMRREENEERKKKKSEKGMGKK